VFNVLKAEVAAQHGADRSTTAGRGRGRGDRGGGGGDE
jgi:hypothetical protein